MMNNEFKAGNYYVGDLCYYLTSEEWVEVCDITQDPDNVSEGIFKLDDGRKFALWGAAFGDGVYNGTNGLKFSVDSGTIGCIKIIDTPHVGAMDGGHVIEMPDFITSKSGGTISFGDLHIDTDDTDDDEE
jgi:hypothetical protein